MSLSDQPFTPPQPLKTAVLFLIFNRLDTTKQVFEAIRMAKPPRLYIAADGARESREGEAKKVQEVRDYVTSHIDWQCEVKTLFRDRNLGCKYAVSAAITWFFENEEMGIILEDDCLPCQSFFWFCEQLLEKYKNDMRVWHISGASMLTSDILINNDSYYFSRYNHIWGWGSWANRWKYYNIKMPLFPDFLINGFIKNITKNKLLQTFWLYNFKKAFDGEIDTWDYQWYFTTWSCGGISIIPVVNLVSNIGFGIDATHTSDIHNKLSNVLRKEINLDIIHPKIIMPNLIYDEFNGKILFNLNYAIFYWNNFKKMIKNILTLGIK
ncbi:MAG: nucleotide-diphospho-sugar transferase [Spirochaetia bacterium]|nr:nucleotide-diphospho-sugar transferase [Spirochaetia bacterium]